MTPIDIFEKFKKVYPVWPDDVGRFLAFDTNVIQVRLKNRKELVFTYFSSNKWKIESMDLYNSEIKKKGKGLKK